MLKIPLTKVEANGLADRHARSLLSLIKTRLKDPDNRPLALILTKDQDIMDVLKCKPGLLKKKNNELISKLKTAGSTDKKIQEMAKDVFGYKYFFQKADDRYCAYDLCTDIGLVSCPYCNINFANTIHSVRRRSLVLRPPLDHFHAYSLYPFIALSFYNLIPSCWICNSTFKKNEDTDVTTHLNPYLGSFDDDCQLDLKDFRSINDVLAPMATKFMLYFKNNTGDARFKGNIELFKLDLCYNEFKATARRSLVAAMNYNDDAINGILKAVKGDKADAYRMVFNSEFETEHHHRVPFSKVNRDIISQYGSAELKSLLQIK